MKKLSFIKNKKYVAYSEKSFLMIKIRKMNLNCTKESEIIVITPENLEELLIIFAI